MITLNLFKENWSCKACSFSWEGYSHGFARGHSILTKDKKFIFIADDIWYSFPIGTNVDINLLFFNIGWFSIESCPKCKSSNLSSPVYDSKRMVNIECEEIKNDHFFNNNGKWQLAETALLHFT